MGDRTDGLDGLSTKRMDRRESIRTALKVGGVAYVAPIVLASAAPASAQVSNPSPGCVGANCQTFIACTSDPDCFCWSLSTGGGFCGHNFLCANVPDCGPGNTCAPGSVCAVNTCCVVAKCTPVSSLCVADAQAQPPITGGLTAAGPR